ncbi:hypothetical protein [Lederbergia galactosidilytica]|uniref:Uncharacterized protein n=1 Tax=Lederbergia galactosidilytica TaxID=217031 RepID=A0A177ZQ33_9BACI|nr:hypothetical protein [Lederbergia galactosidilytica]OAK70082.1 hypothetical protein ABB05_12940 [Lederbergia galactosidilytica]
MYILQVREDVNKREQNKLLDLNPLPKKTEWRESRSYETIEEARQRAIELIENNYKTADNVRVLKQVATFEAVIKVKENKA